MLDQAKKAELLDELVVLLEQQPVRRNTSITKPILAEMGEALEAVRASLVERRGVLDKSRASYLDRIRTVREEIARLQQQVNDIQTAMVLDHRELLEEVAHMESHAAKLSKDIEYGSKTYNMDKDPYPYTGTFLMDYVIAWETKVHAILRQLSIIDYDYAWETMYRQAESSVQWRHDQDPDEVEGSRFMNAVRKFLHTYGIQRSAEEEEE